MNDPLDDRIASSLSAEATLTTDPSAAHAEFINRRRQRHQRLVTGAAVAAVIALTTGVLAVTNYHRPKGAAVSATGHTTGPHPLEGAPPGSSDTTATSTSAPEPTASTVARGSTATTRALSPTPTPTTSSSTAPPVGPGPPPPGSIVVTNADNGKHYTLVRGQDLVVELQPEGYMWTEPASSSSDVLPRDGGWTRGDGSASGTFRGASTGTADVTADGRSIPPPCATATPRCLVPDHILHFSVSVTVVG
ncbi:MAG TPA: hypothetical protein VG076_05120 [Acidimicrobiales bacterium]|nr:hypothetical protein [Acidimicrobiales bacterium]